MKNVAFVHIRQCTEDLFYYDCRLRFVELAIRQVATGAQLGNKPELA